MTYHKKLNLAQFCFYVVKVTRVCLIDPFRPQIEITAVNCVGGKKIEMVFDEGKNRMAAW